jgi:hypothetical protein
MAAASVLTLLQRDFLSVFFARPTSKAFFLTSGTALAEFYLHHRYSDDIDLFTQDSGALALMENDLSGISQEIGCAWSPGVKATDFRPIFLRRGSEPQLKIDFVRDPGPQFGECQIFGNVIVDSELNIAVNKVTALFGRAAPKDFVAHYFLLKKGYDLDELMRLAKEKDMGFSEFYFAGMLHENRRITLLPRMTEPLTVDELRAFFEPLATKIVLRLKPLE